LPKNRSVVRCAEKLEFVWWPLLMPPAFCTLSAPDQCHTIPREHSSGTHQHRNRFMRFANLSGYARAALLSSRRLRNMAPAIRALLARHTYSARPFE
jgi:hypothetical protein